MVCGTGGREDVRVAGTGGGTGALLKAEGAKGEDVGDGMLLITAGKVGVRAAWSALGDRSWAPITRMPLGSLAVAVTGATAPEGSARDGLRWLTAAGSASAFRACVRGGKGGEPAGEGWVGGPYDGDPNDRGQEVAAGCGEPGGCGTGNQLVSPNPVPGCGSRGARPVAAGSVLLSARTGALTGSAPGTQSPCPSRPPNPAVAPPHGPGPSEPIANKELGGRSDDGRDPRGGRGAR